MRKHVGESELALFAGGDASGRHFAKIEAHVHACPECTATLESFCNTRRWMERCGTEPSAEDLAEVRFRLMDRLITDRKSRRRWLWVASLPAVVSVLAVLWWPTQKKPLAEFAFYPETAPLQVTRVLEIGEIRQVAPVPVGRKRRVAAAGLHTAQLLSRSGQPLALRMTTANPNVVILLQTEEGNAENE